MKSRAHDVIVVGARCAGAPTAMLLARKGYRVLMVDRAGFPSDTVSTHMIHAAGRRRAAAVGTCSIRSSPAAARRSTRYSFDFGPFTHRRARRVPSTAWRRPTHRDARCSTRSSSTPRSRPGVEVREHFTVEDVVFDDDAVVGIRGHGAGGPTVMRTGPRRRRCRRPQLADRQGRRARTQYHDKPMLLWGYYTYWSDLPTDGFETIIRPDRGWAAAPTNDGLTHGRRRVAGHAEPSTYKSDVEANYLATLDLAPEFAERVSACDTGRALHGQAACRTSSARRTAQDGRSSATPGTPRTRSRRRASATPSATPSCAPPPSTKRSAAPARSTRRCRPTSTHATKQVLPMYEFTTQLATLEPPPPEMQQLLGAVHGNQRRDGPFVSVAAGVVLASRLLRSRQRRADHGGGMLRRAPSRRS